MKFNSKNLLVTGGSGFIGSNFIHYLFNKYDKIKIFNLDSLTYAGDINNTKTFKDNSRYSFIKGDICDKNLVDHILNVNKIDGIINFAAETHVDNSITNPDVFVKTNINGVFNLLNCSYNYWMHAPFKVKKEFELARFHQISTDEVYGSIEIGSFSEESNYAPNSPYSSSKASADMLVRGFNKTYGLNSTISICSNNYGPNQNVEKFIPKIINCLINNELIPVYGDGCNVRDWIYVEDHCSAIDIVFNKSRSGCLYNIGAENELTNLELIDIIYSIIKKDTIVKKRVNFIKDRPGHDRRYSLNIDKIRKDFNWNLNSNFNDNLSNYIKNLI